MACMKRRQYTLPLPSLQLDQFQNVAHKMMWSPATLLKKIDSPLPIGLIRCLRESLAKARMQLNRCMHAYMHKYIHTCKGARMRSNTKINSLTKCLICRQGLCVAYQLKQRDPGMKVTLLERAAGLGVGSSGEGPAC